MRGGEPGEALSLVFGVDGVALASFLADAGLAVLLTGLAAGRHGQATPEPGGIGVLGG